MLGEWVGDVLGVGEARALGWVIRIVGVTVVGSTIQPGQDYNRRLDGMDTFRSCAFAVVTVADHAFSILLSPRYSTTSLLSPTDEPSVRWLLCMNQSCMVSG